MIPTTIFPMTSPTEESRIFVLQPRHLTWRTGGQLAIGSTFITRSLPLEEKQKKKAINDPSTYESPGRRKRQLLMFKQKKRRDAFVETEHLLEERTSPIFFHLKRTRTHEMKNEEYTLFFCMRSRRRQETRLLHSPRNKSVKLTTSKHKHNFWFWSLL